MKKRILNIFYLIIIVLLAYIVISWPRSTTRKETRCQLKNSYYKLLEYDNFKNGLVKKNQNISNYNLLADSMHIFNKECKRHNAIEDKTIDDNLKKIKINNINTPIYPAP